MERKVFGVVALDLFPVDPGREKDDRMAHVEKIVQPVQQHVGLSGFTDYRLHGGFFFFGFRTSILTFGAAGASLVMAIFTISSMCCKYVAPGRFKESRSNPPEKENSLDVTNRQCKKALESCSRPTIIYVVVFIVAFRCKPRRTSMFGRSPLAVRQVHLNGPHDPLCF